MFEFIFSLFLSVSLSAYLVTVNYVNGSHTAKQKLGMFSVFFLASMAGFWSVGFALGAI